MLFYMTPDQSIFLDDIKHTLYTFVHITITGKQEQLETTYVHQGEFGSGSGVHIWIGIISKIFTGISLRRIHLW